MTIIEERELNFIKRALCPVEKSPNLGARRLIKAFYDKGIRKFAIAHRDIQEYKDTEGKVYQDSELL
jgi:hypothetical protein